MSRSQSPQSPAAHPRRRALAQLCLSGVVAALMVWVPAPASATGPEVPTGTSVRGVRTDTSVPELRAVPAHGATGGTGVTGTDGAEAETVRSTRVFGGERDIAEFVLIGVGYRSASGGPARVRVRTDGEWGAWTGIVRSGDHRPDAATSERRAEQSRAMGNGAPVSEPIWIDHADAYQLDLPGDAVDAEVFLVRETNRRVRVTPATDRAGAAPGEPLIRPRASWGAAPYRGTPELSPPLRNAFVHHTVNANDYSEAQVPGMLRSVQAYHQDARGWSDIGYNFVIDRFGGIWEARDGGIRNPVIGAHAKDHNRGSFGVSFLGEATDSVPAATIDAFGRLIGWKMFISGVRPTAQNIMGHRDVGQTACPGNALYANLGRIRSLAADRYGALVGPGTFSANAVSVSAAFAPLSGDFNGDGYGDILWYGAGDQPDGLWFGTFTGFTGRPLTVSGTYTPTVGDFNGDGRSDVFWYGPGASPDAIWFGRTDGSFAPKAFTVGGVYEPLAGDFDGDGKHDVLWYGAGALNDVLWFGTSSSTFVGRATVVDSTSEPFTGDFDGDGRTDVFWYGPGAAADSLWFGEANRGFSARPATIRGTYVPIVADVTGGGADDIVWYGPGAATDVLFLGRSDRTFGRRSVTMADDYSAPFAGDWNADGRGDVFWYRPAGSDLLWLARGAGA